VFCFCSLPRLKHANGRSLIDRLPYGILLESLLIDYDLP
jgi:hypothetical protein